jgi:predicted ribosomally synthesized peptide with SipW-like signal peptide
VSRLKLTLACMLVLGGVSCLTISGTYAMFTAQEKNATATATSGTLTLSDGVTNGTTTTTCSSSGTGTTGNVNSSCTALMTSGTLQYPGIAATAKVTLSDTGTIGGSSLSVFMNSCTNTTSPSSTGHQGGGNACAAITDGTTADGLELTIQETNSSWTPTQCWYPTVASGTCTSTANSFSSFATNNSQWFTAKSLGSGPTVTTPRYFLVSVLLPTYASPSLQGEQATYSLTWHLTS